jgi:hypothetical protein
VGLSEDTFMRLTALFALVLASACGFGRDLDDLGDAGPMAGSDATPPDLREVDCVDQSISSLMLLEETAPAAIAEDEDDGAGGFETRIDATAGGMPPKHSFVYALFTEDGLEQVDVGDEDAFESLDWHIAFRRYVVRLNSGVSGPGDITAARTAPDTEFEALEELPDGLDQRTEEYFTASCDYVTDSTGIGAPATALASFWSYSGCLKMTGNVYVLALDGGRHVKFQVLGYYPPDVQAMCNETSTIPMPSGAGDIRIRWAFLPE